MSSLTPNLSLILPIGQEYVSRAVFNGNMTLIDTAVGHTIKDNLSDQLIQNPTSGGLTCLRVKSSAATNSEAYMRADAEGGNIRVAKGTSVFEIDANNLADNGTGYGRIYTSNNGSNLKIFQFKQNGDFVNGNGVSLDNLNSNIAKNVLDAGIDISGYSSSNKYTAPSDGYVLVSNNSGQTGYLALYDSKTSIGGNMGRFSCYVRKGCVMYPVGTYNAVYFIPFA